MLERDWTSCGVNNVECQWFFGRFSSAFLCALLAFPATSLGAEEKPKPQILFTNVTVFDGTSATLADGMSVLVAEQPVWVWGERLR